MPRSGWKTWLLVTLILSLIIVGATSFLGWRQSVPGVRGALTPPPAFIGIRTPLALTLTAARGGVASFELRLVQGTQKVTANLPLYRTRMPALLFDFLELSQSLVNITPILGRGERGRGRRSYRERARVSHHLLTP